MIEKNTLTRLYNISLKFLVPLTASETYEAITKEAIKFSHASHGTLYVTSQDFVIPVFSTLRPKDLTQPRKDGNIFTSYRKQKVMSLTGKQLQKGHPNVDIGSTKSLLILPLMNQGKSIGVISLRSNKSKYFTKGKIKTLTLFSTIASLALRKTQLYDKIRRALESRDYFISLASHELRTPLTSIGLYTRLIEKAVEKNTMPSLAWIRSMSNEISRTTHLFSQLLEVEKIKSGELVFFWKVSHLLDIVQAAVTRFRVVHPDQTLIVTKTTDKKHDIISCDPEKLLQVLTNVLNNSAKFSAKNTTIVVNVFHKQQTVTVTITDQGKGILKEDLSRIFERFFKGTGNEKEGMGLGLFLSKHIMEVHHGSIHITSELKKGTTVILEFPRIL